MIMSGGNNALWCKFFVGTLTNVALDWFSGIVDGFIACFARIVVLMRSN